MISLNNAQNTLLTVKRYKKRDTLLKEGNDRMLAYNLCDFFICMLYLEIAEYAVT